MNEDSKWKRKLPVRIYDYNYKVSQSYYAPQTDYIDDRSYLRSKIAPPECQSYAERFANKPWYGGVKGLPYDMADSALSKPLVNRRAVSASRATSIMKDREDNVPPHIRTSRRSKLVEDEVKQENKFKPKAHLFNLEDDIEFTPSALSSELRRDLKKLEHEIETTKHQPRRSSFSYDQSLLDDDLSLHRSSYSTPYTGSTVSKSSYTENKRFDSKPPITGSVRSRRVSFSDDDFLTAERPPRPRGRQISAEAFTSRPPKSLDSLRNEDYEVHVSAKELRDMRRAKESEDLTDHIQKLVSKMRARDVDKEDAYKYTRTIRSSSLEPLGDNSKYGARQQQMKYHNFVYGSSKLS